MTSHRQKAANQSVLRRLVTVVAPFWKSVLFLAFLALVTAGLGLITPYLTRPLVDEVLAPQVHATSPEHRMHLLVWIIGGMIGSQILGQIVGILQFRTSAMLTQRVAHTLRVRVYEHLHRLSLRFYDQRQIGSLMTCVLQDTDALETVLTVITQFLLVQCLTFVCIAAVLWRMNVTLLLVALIPIPALIFISQVSMSRVSTLWRRRLSTRAQLGALLNDALSGMRVIRAFAQERREIARFTPLSNQLAEDAITAEQTSSAMGALLSVATAFGAIIIWFVGGRMIIANDLTLGTLTTFIAYLSLFYGTLQAAGRLPDRFGRGLASAERVFEVLDTEPDVLETRTPAQMSSFQGQLIFQNVTFSYDGQQSAVQNLNLEIAVGEMIGLVGHSGAGKTTLINLLCRFYDCDEGRILVDGVDIRQIAQDDLRSQIGVVLQETFLFSGSIADNIAYARPSASADEIISAAKAANAHDFIRAKPDGYETLVGERGAALSGGERQRIAIARAILHNPRILILDEATSAIDTETEELIRQALDRLIQGRTTIAIAHRLSTLRSADRLIVLKQGRIIEYGTHEELLSQTGEFYRLVRIQEDARLATVLEREEGAYV